MAEDVIHRIWKWTDPPARSEVWMLQYIADETGITLEEVKAYIDRKAPEWAEEEKREQDAKAK